MNRDKTALGKGIRALLENMEEPPSTLTEEKKGSPVRSIANTIPLSQIEVNPFQPRADFDEQSLKELSESIKVHGIIQPLTVKFVSANRYQLISGERRLRASKMADLGEVPAYIREANDQEMLEIALIENIQRENLNAIEISINYKRLMDECGLTQEQLARRLGKNRSSVTNFLRLLRLPPDIQQAIKLKKISMGHARALITIADVDVQLSLAAEIIQKELSVRKVEEKVRAINSGQINRKKATPAPTLPLAFKKIQDDLSSKFSTQVKFKIGKNNSGEISIAYFSDEDLNRILELLD